MKLLTLKKRIICLMWMSVITVVSAFAEGTSIEVRETAKADPVARVASGTQDEAPPSIKTSEPYPLHRLFTVPTAHALQSYGLRFGGEGNIHSTLAHMRTTDMHATIAMGLGGVAELGYQLDEYRTAGESIDNIMMGHFKLMIIKEKKFLPAVAVSAGQNLKEDFHDPNNVQYKMARSAFDLVMSKSFFIGSHLVSVHPGVEMFSDKLKEVVNTTRGPNSKQRLYNYRLGVSWQTQPKILFMYESKYLNLINVSNLENVGLSSSRALENNLGVRYYIRNWLCMDAGIRYFYDLETEDDDMKLHANFVGVVPLNTVYTRIENLFKK